MSNFDKNRTGTGTREWSDVSYNIQKGCSHRCLYCYACESALRYKRINNREEWLTETIDLKAVNKKWTSSNKVIMFPTTHDITPDNIDYCITTLKNMLKPGNKVLIVNKPHLSCVEKMCSELEPWKEQMLFRFTIGSFNKVFTDFWEPGATSPVERLCALKWAFDKGFETSVSMEPMLYGYEEAMATFKMVNRYITETIWIGKMNKIRNRVDMTNPDNREMVKELEKKQCDEEILKLVESLKDEPKVRWKDSIKAVIAREGK